MQPSEPPPPYTPTLTQSRYSQDQDSIRTFQENQFGEGDEQWDRLVPEEARASLSEREVNRQGAIFEIIKSEKEYVADLETLQVVFFTPLLNARLPIIDFEKDEVFSNFDRILAHERRFLAALYERQREQYPMITSVMDIILDVVLAFRDDYESYIKHYPLARARHNRESQSNEGYKAFLSVTWRREPRAKKGDLTIFMSQPVTRLPRLSLILEQVLKYTPEDHTDHETISLILDILSWFAKSTVPGVQATEDKVKCFELGENIVFRETELIDLDFYGETRTVVHEGTVWRKEKANASSTEQWLYSDVKLLDHYFILTEERAITDTEVKTEKYFVNSHPIPLDFLRRGQFIGQPETFTALFLPPRFAYPFVIVHAGNLEQYILYASSEAERDKWKEALEETKNLRDMWMDGNKLFGFNVIQDGRFRSHTIQVPSSTASEGFTGRIICATAFRRHERNFLAIATEDGVYVSLRDNLDRPVQVLQLPNVTHMIALESYDCFVLIVEKTLYSYSLEPLASVALGQVPSKPVEQTMQILAPRHKGHVAFFRVGSFGDRDYLVYGTPGPVYTAIHTLLITHEAFQPRKGDIESLLDVAYDAYFMSKSYAIVSEKGITILDPDDSSNVIMVPDFSESNSNAAMSALKSQCDSARALGIVDVSQHERLVIYDEHGCYVDVHGKPMRDCKWVRWEIKAKSFSYRHPHLLLFGDDFIDIRHAPTGQYKQMVKAKDIRYLDSIGIGGWKGSLFLEWRGSHNDKDGQSWALVEGLETGPL